MTEADFLAFLDEVMRWKPERLVLHQCCVIMPKNIVEAHEAAGCPGKSERFDEVAARLERYRTEKAE